ncbi:hypothetical protein HHL16_09175 [Pseudoflavitalea sp. G-6-1-2]|uniref:hypothetical protein n=1 Tax=Pseudoflavitalea sp. G-6-1-2 TaxID=2728841 RepID=UPI00146CE99E|nr:hypothetical protein [Pseudoflavitalea sp. G-6-1-2]NML21043.1 hypothetical protein [Pseudoflavitalea sp. G-6-1-2]
MKSFIIIIIFAILLISCSSPKSAQTGIPVNHILTDTSGDIELAGIATESRLKETPFGQWYNTNYEAYSPDASLIVQLSSLLKGKNIQIFMGTWCGDSRREVPRMFKVLHQCGVKPSSIQLICTGRTDSTYKQSPTHEERGKDIFRVPTLIVYEHGKETGRIVESPVHSIEADLLAICRNEQYVPQYRAAGYLLKWYVNPKWQQRTGDTTELLSILKPLCKNAGELLSLGRIQLGAGEVQKAVFTHRLNSMLYPDLPAVWNQLGISLQRVDAAAAQAIFQKAANIPKQ